MKKFTAIAAMLAMVLVAAVPAFAQTTVDNSDNEIDNNVEESFNGNNIAVNDSDIVQNGGDQSVVSGNGNVNINEQDAEQDSNAFAGDVQYGFEDRNNGDFEDRNDNNFEDADFDGIDDDFDFFVLFGGFDNGVNSSAVAFASAE